MKKLFAKISSIFMAAIMAIAAFFGIAPNKEPPQYFGTVKNVIFMIGDGMGFNSIEKAVKETGLTYCNMKNFPLQGESKTRSANSPVTDSAAGGSALSCGIRINNSSVAVYPYDKNAKESHPMNLAELAIENGKTAGVITTDSTSGATPASFSAHTSSRKNEADITAQQLASDLTLVWGTSTESFSEQTAKENGFEVVYDLEQMEVLEEGSRSFAQFTDDVWHNCSYNGMPTLTEMTKKAIDLVDDDEDGFFLMVEGAHIDKNSHKNNGEGMGDALCSFDSAVGIALDYAKTHEGTLVVVTADHETGGITKIAGNYIYTLTSHSGVNVPLLVYGCDGFIKNKEKVDNKEVAVRTARAMGFNDFPRKIELK